MLSDKANKGDVIFLENRIKEKFSTKAEFATVCEDLRTEMDVVRDEVAEAMKIKADITNAIKSVIAKNLDEMLKERFI